MLGALPDITAQCRHRRFFERPLPVVADFTLDLLECSPATSPQLVTSCISQHDSAKACATRKLDYSRPDLELSFQVYRHDLKVIRKWAHLTPTKAPGARRGAVDAFSDASRRRLRFSAANSHQALVSQFGLTYHNSNPDGPTAKTHLNAFLTALRRQVPGVSYLWVMEFQGRGVLHFHLFLSVLPSDELREWMAVTWNRITAESAEHLRFHSHRRNFCTWRMRSGAYLTKYLDKSAQKAVPDGFGWAGRFWGASRALVGAPVEFTRQDFGSVARPGGPDPLLMALRTLDRFQRAQYRRLGCSRGTLMHSAYSRQVSGASGIFWQLLDYFERNFGGAT